MLWRTCRLTPVTEKPPDHLQVFELIRFGLMRLLHQLTQHRPAGFAGCYLNKAGMAREGEAMFWRTSRLTLVKEQPLSIRSLFTELLAASPGSPLAQRHSQLLPMLHSSKALRIALSKVSSLSKCTYQCIALRHLLAALLALLPDSPLAQRHCQLLGLLHSSQALRTALSRVSSHWQTQYMYCCMLAASSDRSWPSRHSQLLRTRVHVLPVTRIYTGSSLLSACLQPHHICAVHGSQKYAACWFGDKADSS